MTQPNPPRQAPTSPTGSAVVLLVVMVAVLALGAVWLFRARWGLDAPTRELRRRASAETRTARALEPLESAGWVLLHDRLVANERVPHILVGPPGAVVLHPHSFGRAAPLRALTRRIPRLGRRPAPAPVEPAELGDPGRTPRRRTAAAPHPGNRTARGTDPHRRRLPGQHHRPRLPTRMTRTPSPALAAAALLAAVVLGGCGSTTTATTPTGTPTGTAAASAVAAGTSTPGAASSPTPAPRIGPTTAPPAASGTLPVEDPDHGTAQPFPTAGSCHARHVASGTLPDPTCTPGATDPHVTQATIATTICRPSGYTSTVRPPQSVTSVEKRASITAYAAPGPVGSYEFDHLVSLELGGSPNSPHVNAGPKLTPCCCLGSRACRNTAAVDGGVLRWVVEVGSVSLMSRRGTGSCCPVVSVRSRRAAVRASRARPGTGGAPRLVVARRGWWWRAEAGGVAPARLAEAVRSNRYLSLLERQRIASLREKGAGIREIAIVLGRAASTVSRELSRNTARHDRRGYEPVVAHARARARAARPGRSRLLVDQGLRVQVQAKLDLEWSPEQIAAHLRAAFPDNAGWHGCHETIYQALYKGSRGGLSRTLTKRLRTGRPLRKRRRRPEERRTRYIVAHRTWAEE